MRSSSIRLAALALLALAAACSTGGRYSVTPNPHTKVGKPYQVSGIWYVPKHEPNYDKVGMASWYGPGFHGRLTANGEVFDEDRLTAAHPTLPLPSIVEVTNYRTGRRVRLRVNDRGPFAQNRIIDLSKEAARRLGTQSQGVAKVRVRYIGPARISDAILRTGQRERGQALAVGQTTSRQIFAGPTPPAPPRDEDLILSDLDYAIGQASPAPAPRPVSYSSSRFPLVQASLPMAGGAYFIQVGAFSSRTNAAAAASRFAAQDQVSVLPRQIGGRYLHLVRLGPFASPGMAQSALSRARIAGFADARLVEEVPN